MPSVLVESGFVTHAAEAKRLARRSRTWTRSRSRSPRRSSRYRERRRRASPRASPVSLPDRRPWLAQLESAPTAARRARRARAVRALSRRLRASTSRERHAAARPGRRAVNEPALRPDRPAGAAALPARRGAVLQRRRRGPSELCVRRGRRLCAPRDEHPLGRRPPAAATAITSRRTSQAVAERLQLWLWDAQADARRRDAHGREHDRARARATRPCDRRCSPRASSPASGVLFHQFTRCVRRRAARPARALHQRPDRGGRSTATRATASRSTCSSPT